MRGDRHPPLSRLLDSGRAWLAIAIVVAAVLFGVYYITHPYPAYGGGLFLAMADQIQNNGYRLPTTIPHYTRGGVPFAYPPLMFYVIAGLLDIGIDPFVLTRIFPGIVTILYLIPFYYLAKELLTERTAGIATVIIAVTPRVLRWHLSAGGIIRAPAYLIMLTGLYVGVRLFKSGDRRWLVSALVLFGITVLSHPTYSTFFGVSYLVLYAAYDRSLAGLIRGATVAVGGLLLAVPWWAHVITTYSITTLTGAAATHRGLISSPMDIAMELITVIFSGTALSLWWGLMIIGAAVLLWRRRFFLPVWLFVSLMVMNEKRFPLVPGVLIIAVLLSLLLDSQSVESVDGSRWETTDHGSVKYIFIVIICFMVIAGGVSASGTLLGSGPSMVSFVDTDDRTAMQWVQTHTSSNATFVVLGDTGEWFPYLTHRTSLVGRWGVEWVSADRYRTQLTMFWNLSTCHTAQCLTENLHRYDVHPDYVYVPTERYTVITTIHKQPASMRRTLTDSNAYKLVYENDEVMIFRVVETRRSADSVTHDSRGVGGVLSPDRSFLRGLPHRSAQGTMPTSLVQRETRTH
jgi:hypothetical protein